MIAPYPCIAVVGADTDAGKTLISAAILKITGGTYWKPIQSGSIEGTDTQTIRRLSEIPDSHFLPEAYSFQAPVSPHLAAAMEDQVINREQLYLPAAEHIAHLPLIIEGAGGVMVPLAENLTYLDVLASWNIPALIVGRNRLGVINHMLLTISACRNRGIYTPGYILSGSSNLGNQQAISTYGDIQCLAVIPEIDFEQNYAFHQVCNAIDSTLLEELYFLR